MELLETHIFNPNLKTPSEIVFDVKFRSDTSSIIEDCECSACKMYHKAYLYHLVKHNEMLSSVILSIHNNYMYSAFFKILNTEFIVKNFGLASLILKVLSKC